MKLKQLFAVLTAGAIAALTLSSCAGITLETGETAVDTELACRVGLYTPINGDYLFTSAWGDAGSDRDIRSLIHGAENVSIVKENTYAYNPSVISSVSITDGADGSRTYTYNLVSGLRYSDGSALTAKDYVFSVLLQASPAFAELTADKSGSKNPYALLEGYDAYASGESGQFTGVRWISDSRFSLTIAAENLPNYQEMLLTQVYPIPSSVIAPDAVLDDDGSGATITGLTAEGLTATLEGETGYRYFPQVTAGPYILESVEDGVYTLTANPYYAGGYYKRQPSISRLTVETADLENGGDYDLIVGITGKDAIEEMNRLLADGVMTTSYYYDSMTVSSLTFSDSVSAGVRSALSQLIDTEEAVTALAGHWGQVSLGNIPLASSLYQGCYATLSTLTKTYPASASVLLTAENGDEPVELTYELDAESAESRAMLSLLQEIAADEPLLSITSVSGAGAADADLRFTRTQFGKDWGAWQGMEGTALEDAAADLRHTIYDVNSTRYADKLAAFEQSYIETLPDLPLAVYKACDLVGKRLIGYSQVDVYDDWTVWIQYSRLVDLSDVR